MSNTPPNILEKSISIPITKIRVDVTSTNLSEGIKASIPIETANSKIALAIDIIIPDLDKSTALSPASFIESIMSDTPDGIPVKISGSLSMPLIVNSVLLTNSADNPLGTITSTG